MRTSKPQAGLPFRHGSELDIGRNVVAGLGLDQHIPAGLDAGGQQHVVNGGQGQFRRVVGLAQVAQRKLFAAVLDQLQQRGGAGAVVQVAAVAGNAEGPPCRLNRS